MSGLDEAAQSALHKEGGGADRGGGSEVADDQPAEGDINEGDARSAGGLKVFIFPSLCCLC
jgi:hypothetical protein